MSEQGFLLILRCLTRDASNTLEVGEGQGDYAEPPVWFCGYTLWCCFCVLAALWVYPSPRGTWGKPEGAWECHTCKTGPLLDLSWASWVCDQE